MWCIIIFHVDVGMIGWEEQDDWLERKDDDLEGKNAWLEGKDDWLGVGLFVGRGRLIDWEKDNWLGREG